MHSNLSHAYHEQYSKKKDSIKEKNREREREKREKYVLFEWWSGKQHMSCNQREARGSHE